MSVAGANHDGKVLLFDEDGIVGSTLDVAIGNITSLATKYGYLTQDNSTVSVNVVSNKDSAVIVKTIDDSIQKVANSTQLTLSLKQKTDLSLEEELSALKKEYSGNPDIQALDVARLCLVKKARQNGESIEDVCSKPLNELLAKVNEVQSDAMSKFDNAYSSQVEKAQYLFDSACSVLQNGLRVSFYIENLADLSSLQKIFVSLQYTLAKSAKLTLEYFDACLDLNSVNKQYYLDEKTLQTIADELGTTYDELINKTHAVKRDDCITIDEQDLKSYINTLYRNADSALAQNIKNAYSSIDAILASSQSMVDGHDGAVAFFTKTFEDILSSAQLNFLNDITDKYASSITAIIGEFFPDDLDISNKESISNAISQLENKITSIESELDFEDEQAFRQYCEQKGIAQKLTELRNQLSTALADLKQNAVNSLSQEKASRL